MGFAVGGGGRGGVADEEGEGWDGGAFRGGDIGDEEPLGEGELAGVEGGDCYVFLVGRGGGEDDGGGGHGGCRL